MKYYQISYPRSGANWLRYIARNLLDIKGGYLEESPDDEVYIKRHKISQVDYSRGLVVLIRNYRECIIRHGQMGSFGKALTSYYYGLELLDKPFAKKLVIYYEDLMLDPYTQIRNFAKFLDVDNNIISNFLNNYEEYRNISINSYDNVHGSKTRGDDINFYSKQHPEYIIGQLDNMAQKYNPELFKTYLERYL